MRFLLLFGFFLLPSIRPLAQGFTVQAGKILAPDGTEFVIRGVNVNGPYWPWSRPTAPDADLIAGAWKFNTVRVNCFPSLRGTFPQNNPNLDEIVNALTGRKVVVQLENHDFTGKYPADAQLDDLKAWWVDLANRFKNNPYVWFNVMNEPGSSATVPETWKTAHEAVVNAIRGTGATNVIVLDEHGFGQGNGFKDGVSNSGVLTYGPYFTKNYPNIAFSLHLYSTWIYGQARLEAYLDEAKARGLAVHVGEFGAADGYSKSVAADLFRVALTRNLGTMVWQWDGSDTHDLTRGTTRGGGWEIDRTDGSLPGNLSFVGNLVWKSNRGELRAGSADFTLTAPWLYNGSFEQGLDEWINWGGAEVEQNTGNARDGQKNVRIASGNPGGCGQPIYLTPGETYVVQAWGRNSLKPDPATDLGVQYKVNNGPTQYATLSFTETDYTFKRREFTLPLGISEATVFMWKADKNATFYADGIQIFLKREEVVLGTAPEPVPRAFPNPTTGELLVPLDGLDPDSLRLTDATGQTLPLTVQRVDDHAARVRLGAVPPGVYLLRAGTAVLQKVVVQR
jgi:hypothetical protein